MKRLAEQSVSVERPVLCAVDASEHGAEVARTGARLALLAEAPLILLHVYRRTGHRQVIDRALHPDRQASDLEAAETLLSHRAAELLVAPTLELSGGDPAEQILCAAEDIDPAFIVLGTRARGALDALRGTSVARQVSAAATHPTMLVPDSFQPMPVELVVVCGIEHSRASTRIARCAARLAAAQGARVRLVALVDDGLTRLPLAEAGLAVGAASALGPELVQQSTRRDQVLAATRDQAERVAAAIRNVAPVEVVVEVGDPAARLLAVADEVEATAIAVGDLERPGLTTADAGGLAQSLAESSRRPVLRVP